MLTRRFAQVVGVVYVLVGILGFVHPIALLPASHPSLSVTAAYGYLLSLFPINVLHNIVHIAIGLAGLAAARQYVTARNFARGLAVLYIVLAVMGLFPGLKTTFGLIPLFGADILLHLLTGLVAAYFGFGPDREDARATGSGSARAVGV